MKKTEQIAAALLMKEGRLLIGKRNDCPIWEFPGGKLEPGETPEEALCRECMEELSLKITPRKLIWETEYEYPQKRVHLYFFTADSIGGELQNQVHTELLWVSPQSLGDYSFWPANQELIRKIAGGELSL